MRASNFSGAILGPSARVLSPPEWQRLGADAAAELLARYDAGGSDAS